MPDTTLRAVVPDELHQAATDKAVGDGRTLDQVVAELLRGYVEDSEAKPARRTRRT